MDDDATGVWDWDLSSGKIYFDRHTARMYSFDTRLGVEGLPVATFLERIHPDDVARIEATLSDTMSKIGRYAATFRVRQPEGSFRWVYGRGACLGGNDAHFPGMNFDLGLAAASPHRSFLAHDAAADLLLAAHGATELVGDRTLTLIVESALLRLARISTVEDDPSVH